MTNGPSESIDASGSPKQSLRTLEEYRSLHSRHALRSSAALGGLAGITRTAIVTIFGPTDPRGRLPQVPNTVALWGGEGFACRPCYDGHSYAPCQHNGCMEQVTPEFAFAEVQHMLIAVANGLRLPPRVATPVHTPLVRIASGASPQ